MPAVAEDHEIDEETYDDADDDARKHAYPDGQPLVFKQVRDDIAAEGGD